MTDSLDITSKTRESNLLDSGDSVLVALSGGPDSVALLHLLTCLRKEMRLTLAAVYVNHQIRPRAAKAEEKFCRELCNRLNITLTVVREDIPALAKKQKKSLEETARDFRYAAFERIANREGHARIALGHHADDQVETVLFRLFRGSGPEGLTGIPIKRGKIIRPLLDCSRKELLAYLKRNRLAYVTDASNLKSEFSRNFIRNKLLPVLREKVNPQIDTAILNLRETLSLEDGFLREVVHRKSKRAVRITPGGKIQLDLAVFCRYDKWIRRRVLRRCLKMLSTGFQAPDKEVIDRLEQLAVSGGKALSLPGRLQATRVLDILVLYREGRLKVASSLGIGEDCRLNCPAVTFRCRLYSVRKWPRHLKRAARKVGLDFAKVRPPLQVRTVQPGDRFRPLGMHGSKKIGDYLTDRKLHAVYRDEVLVVEDQEGPIWLAGYEIAERVKVDSKTKRVLEVGFTVRKKKTISTL
jgi:tRNA(Ile)-lysidine synthase